MFSFAQLRYIIIWRFDLNASRRSRRQTALRKLRMWLPALLGLLSPPGGDRPRRTNLDETQLIQLAVTGAPLPTWGLPKEYSQRVDHFSKKEPPDAFAQRYFESDAHFDEANGAVVLYISGEAPLYAAPGSDTYTGHLAAKLRELGAPVRTENYEGLSHEDVVVALSKPFRGNGPVLDRSVTFLDQAM